MADVVEDAVEDAVEYAVFLGALVLSLLALGLFARFVRRSCRGGGVRGALAAFEQVFHATGHDRYVTVQQDRQRTAPAPAPDDPLR